VLKVDESLLSPKLPLQVLAGDELSWTGREYSQHLSSLWAQPNRTSRLTQLTRVEIEFEDAETKRKVPGRGGHYDITPEADYTPKPKS